jgi:peptidoglycan hydrolase-like amidase
VILRTAFLLSVPLLAQDVRIGVFGLFRPTVLEVRSDGALLEIANTPIEDSAWHRLKAGESVTGRGGAPVRFRLRIPNKIERTYEGTLTVESESGRLRPIVKMPLETAVGSIVAAESSSAASFEALKAQAVVSRSYLIAALGRHRSFDACDTTHCQFLKAPPPTGSRADRAAHETEKLALTYDGKVILALYSAQCGGRTRTPQEAGWQIAAYPYFSVECRTCRGKPVQGHRIGLCQRGVVARASRGEKYDTILRYYFPGTSIAAP